jgi:thioredoxin-like negative regulator of GroEL
MRHKIVPAILLGLLLAVLLDERSPESPAVAQPPATTEVGPAWWIRRLPPRCVVICRNRNQTDIIKGLQADLCQRGWCTVVLDLQSAPDVAQHLGAVGPCVVCVCDGGILDVLPATTKIGEVAKVFSEHLAPPAPPPQVDMRQPAEQFTGLVYYTAEWCVACRRYKPLIEALQREGRPVRVVDVGRQPPAGVDSLPTFDFLRDGRRRKRLGGGATESEIRRELSVVTDALSRLPQPRRMWTVDGDDNPSREKLISHLMDGSAHRGKFSRAELEALTREELMRLHSADHEGIAWSR